MQIPAYSRVLLGREEGGPEPLEKSPKKKIEKVLLRIFRLDNYFVIFLLLIKKVKRFEEEHFPGSKSSIERPLKLYSDNQDIAVWLDQEALTERGWMLDETPASQVKWLPPAISIRFSTQG